MSFTRQTIAAMDKDRGFDLIWNKENDEPEAPALPKEFPFRNTRLVEGNFDVRGGSLALDSGAVTSRSRKLWLGGWCDTSRNLSERCAKSA